jgi:hypothetical protein
MLKYAKAIAALFPAGAAALIAALDNGSISGLEWLGIAVAFLATPAAVAAIPNRPAVAKSSIHDVS